MRHDGREFTQLRPMKITPHYTKHSAGSVLMEMGDTKVLCTVSIEDSIPGWLRGMKPPQGWLTAEYCMLPGSTNVRNKRERGHVSGRTQEIQRLIGRSMRGIIDLKKCQDIMFAIDCDVIQADGGTRTTAITGAYVALKIAVDRLIRQGKLKENPLLDGVAAVSIGVKNQQILVDLNYQEDSSADLDMNVVMTHSGKILEIQGTAEKQSFDKHQVMAIMEAAEECLGHVFQTQLAALENL